MINSVFGYISFFVGFLILALPLMLVELSRPRDWVIGGIFLFLGLFLLVEKDLLGGSINLLVIAMAILNGKMMSEIIQNRWYQLDFEEKKRIGSFERWIESFKQLGQSFTFLVKGFLDFFKIFTTQPDKSLKEKKWVHPKLKEEFKKKVVDQSASTDSNKIRNQELPENEETS